MLHGALKRQADTVGGHERAHVRAFRDRAGLGAIKRPHFDFGGATEGSDAFRRTAVAFEDLAVAAYKGQAPRIGSREYLASALAIHSVEARHAAWIRRLAGKSPVAGPFDEPLARPAVTRIVARTHFVIRRGEPQGAEVHRLIPSRGGGAGGRGPGRLWRRQLGRRRPPWSPTSPRPRAGACRSARRCHCAPTRMPRSGRPCAAPRSPAPRRRRRARAVARLSPHTPEGTTNLVLVLGRAHDARGRLWIRARLPSRRARTGWLARAALGGYEVVHTRLIVNRARLTLTLLRNGRAVFRAPVGIGRAATPTPAGGFYVRDRLTRYASPFYGPVAFGTSAQSATLTDWPAGGYVGIHGTDQPDLVPGRVSHGCIRLRNADIAAPRPPAAVGHSARDP